MRFGQSLYHSYNYNSLIRMKGPGKNHGGAKKHPTYIGIFAKDSKEAQKIVRGACKDAILDVLKQFNP